MKHLISEYRLLVKPTKKVLWHDTWVTMLIAIVSAVVISGVDIAITGVIRLFV